MRLFLRILILIIAFQTGLFAQKHSFNASSGANLSKEWRWKKKILVEVRQSLQVNLESKKQDDRVGDIFNELDFMPLAQDVELDSDGDGVADRSDADDDNDGVSDVDDDDDNNGNEDDPGGDDSGGGDDDGGNPGGDDDDNDDDGGGNDDDDDNGGGNTGGGNDDDDDDDNDDDDGDGLGSPVSDRSDPGQSEIGGTDWFMEWRASTSLRTEYRVFDWLRVSGNYGLFYGGNNTRHRLGTELRVLQEVGKFDFSTRVGFQHFAARGEGKVEWDHAMITRFDIEYRIVKGLNAYLSPALNGRIRDGKVDFDRYRLDVGIQWRINRHQNLDFGYRFQQRIGGRKNMAHNVGLTYGYEF
jgi:hypothetical protein